MADLEGRIQSLERAARAWRNGLLVVVSLGCGVVLAGADGKQEASVLRAQGIILQDENGNERVTIKASLDGASITLVNDKGAVLNIAVSDDQSGIVASNSNGESVLVQAQKQRQGISLLDSEGRQRLVIEGSEQGYGLAVTDSKQRPLLQIGGKDSATIRQFSSKGKPIVKLGEAGDSGGVLGLYQPNGALGAAITTSNKGTGLSLYDTKGNKRFGAEIRNWSILYLADERGKLVWGAPE